MNDDGDNDKTRQCNIEARSRIILAEEKCHLFLRVLTRTCGFPEAQARACACVHVALLIQQAKLMRNILTSFLALPFSLSTPFFDIISKNGTIFGKSHWIKFVF